MAYLTAYLPADDAARVLAAVEEVAVPMHRTPGEARRLDECRADAFVGLLTGRLAAAGGTTGLVDDASSGDEPAPRRAAPTAAHRGGVVACT
jgi:hypothetical protein